MLIKDKDILANDNQESQPEQPQKPEVRGINKENMSEAWGDAFDYYLRGITSRYLQFGGRATRLEFWGFAVVASLVYIPLYFLGDYIDMPILPLYYALATIIPSAAVMSRRLHDIDKRAGGYLLLSAILLILEFLFPYYTLIPALVWCVVVIRLLSRPTNFDAELYGNPNEDDEIYGVDNEPIIAKFKLIALIMTMLWFGYACVMFDNWRRQAEQKGTIDQILEDVVTAGETASLTPEQIESAQNIMKQTLRQMQGKSVSDKEIKASIQQAIQAVIPVNDIASDEENTD